MKTRHLISFFVFFVPFVVNSDLGASETVDHAAALTPYLNNDTTIVAYLDVAALPAGGNLSDLIPLLPALSSEAQSSLLTLTIAGGMVKKFQTAGGQGIHVVFGMLDIYDEGGPIVIATTAPNKQPEKVEQFFRDLIHELRDSKQFTNRPLAEILDTRRQGNRVLFGTKHTLDRYVFLKSSPRADILEPLTRLAGEGAVLAVVDAPGPDCRRIFRELWPTLPPPLTSLKGELVDHLKHVEFAANLPPNINPRLVIHTTDPATAQLFAELYRAIPAAVEEFTELGKERQEIKLAVEMITGLIRPQVDGTRVTLRLPTQQPNLGNLPTMLSGLTDKALESTRRRDRFNQFRLILLAMLNYADVKKSLPPAAIRDKDGRPLLSWRVAILPYLDQNELFKQFHLDEPWDSPHNRPLIDKMPAIYSDPDPKTRQAIGTGKTTYQVPVAAETIFFNNNGATFKDINDGTANTIMVVEVDPVHAAVWTKPDDWQVDLEQPRRGIERTDRGIITVAFADGHVEAMPTDVDPARLRAMLTRNSGDEVRP